MQLPGGISSHWQCREGFRLGSRYPVGDFHSWAHHRHRDGIIPSGRADAAIHVAKKGGPAGRQRRYKSLVDGRINHTRSTIVALGIITALALIASVVRAEIVIATVGPMKGPFAGLGDQMKQGAGLAVADLNAKGGVLGQ